MSKSLSRTKTGDEFQECTSGSIGLTSTVWRFRDLADPNRVIAWKSVCAYNFERYYKVLMIRKIRSLDISRFGVE